MRKIKQSIRSIRHTMRNLFFIVCVLGASKYSMGQTNSFPSTGDAVLVSGNSLVYDHAYYTHGYSKYDYSGLPDAAMLNYGYYGHRFATRQAGIAMVIRGNNNYVGIGVTDPAQKLEVSGAIQTSGDAGIVLANSLNNTYGNAIVYGYISRSGGSGTSYPWNANGTIVMQASSYGNTGGFAFITGDSPSVKMAIANNGNVLIGKTTQTNAAYKLDIDGSARANEITVNTTGADFVFEDDYKLRSLAETETFIKQNKHLPDIAPAKEMIKDGVNLGEMNIKLLQKIEELTLYMIEMRKENDSQQKEINQLKSKL